LCQGAAAAAAELHLPSDEHVLVLLLLHRAAAAASMQESCPLINSHVDGRGPKLLLLLLPCSVAMQRSRVGQDASVVANPGTATGAAATAIRTTFHAVVIATALLDTNLCPKPALCRR
jgi:hypothetical protein